MWMLTLESESSRRMVLTVAGSSLCGCLRLRARAQEGWCIHSKEAHDVDGAYI